MPRHTLAAACAVLGAAVCALPSTTLAVGSSQARVSPHETVSATVDEAMISIAYGRPYMRGRRIMGALVPYGHVWCPGADEATTLTTSRRLRLEGARGGGELVLDARSYTLWMLPSADAWKLIVNSETGQWHTRHDSQSDIGAVQLVKRTLDAPVEQLTFAIETKPGAPGGSITMRWETTEVSAPFTIVE